MLHKIICACLLLLFAGNKLFAQQNKDSLPDYMKQYNFRYYREMGMPDSATFFKRMDSSLQQQQKFNEIKRKIDSLQKMIDSLQKLTPQKNSLAYNKQPI